MVSANDTITLHHLFVTPRCWAPNLLALAGTEGCCRGLSAPVSLWEGIDTVWQSSSPSADLGEGCVAVLHRRFSVSCKMTPLRWITSLFQLRAPVYHILGITFYVFGHVSCWLWYSTQRHHFRAAQLAKTHETIRQVINKLSLFGGNARSKRAQHVNGSSSIHKNRRSQLTWKINE